jgi:hypothetical protein
MIRRVEVSPDDVFTVVDAVAKGVYRTGNVERSEIAVAVEEAVLNGDACTVLRFVPSDDLTVVVDARGDGAVRAEGIIDRGVLAVAVDEATLSVAARSIGAGPVPDDLAVVVDAGGKVPFVPRGSSSVVNWPLL